MTPRPATITLELTPDLSSLVGRLPFKSPEVFLGCFRHGLEKLLAAPEAAPPVGASGLTQREREEALAGRRFVTTVQARHLVGKEDEPCSRNLIMALRKACGVPLGVRGFNVEVMCRYLREHPEFRYCSRRHGRRLVTALPAGAALLLSAPPVAEGAAA